LQPFTGHQQRHDFCFRTFMHKLQRGFIVEIDGRQHNQSREADYIRDRRAKAAGFEVLRWSAREAFKNPDAIVYDVHKALARSLNYESHSTRRRQMRT